MSLDIWLRLPEAQPTQGTGIFIRDAGGTREVTWEEWCDRFPGHEPVVAEVKEESSKVYWANITHNVRNMAEAAGINHLWAYWEVEGDYTADKLTPQLEQGIERMEADPDYYRTFDASNGWGTYDDFLPWLKRLLKECKKYPTALVNVSI